MKRNVKILKDHYFSETSELVPSFLFLSFSFNALDKDLIVPVKTKGEF